MALSPSLLAFMRFLVLLLLVCLIFAGSFSFVQPLCHDDESFALLKFKESFTISRSASNDPSAYPKVSMWKPESGKCCRWRGVKCVSDTEGIESKATKSATCAPRVIKLESKAGAAATCSQDARAAATCSQDDQYGQYDTLVQQDPNNHAITDCETSICDCTAAIPLPKKERTAAASLPKKRRKNHNATTHACSSRLHSCSHPEKADQDHTITHYADKENHSRASRSDHTRDGPFDLKGNV